MFFIFIIEINNIVKSLKNKLKYYFMIKKLITEYFSFFVFGSIWIVFWASINTMPFEIYFFGENIIKSINSLRLSLALIISLILIAYFFFKLKQKKNNFQIKENYLIFFFLLLFLSYLISLVFNNERNFNLDNTYLVILSFGTIFLYFFMYNFDLKKNLQNFILINIFFLSLISLVILIPKFHDLASANFNFYQVFSPLDGNIFNQVNPRITGTSRSVAVLNLFIFAIFLNTNKKYLKYFLFSIFILLSFIILMMQSRGTILCFHGSVFILLILTNKFKIFKKFLIILTIIVSNFLIFQMITENQSENKTSNFETRFLNKTTSGRLDIWRYSINNYNYKNLMGFGPQGDRFFLNNYENKKSFGNNSSNAIIYSFLSGGYLGVILILLIYFSLLNKIKNIFSLSANNNIYLSFSLLIIIFFLIRSIYENSFALFSVDYLLMYSSILYIQNFTVKKLS